jgi:hypothetical protein
VIPAVPKNEEYLVLSRSDTVICVNDIEIIVKRAEIQFETLNIIIDAFANDFLKKTTTTYLNAFQIAYVANKTNPEKNRSEDKIHRAIWEIKKSLEQLGISPERILSHTHSLGYKINAENVVLKIRQTGK